LRQAFEDNYFSDEFFPIKTLLRGGAMKSACSCLLAICFCVSNLMASARAQEASQPGQVASDSAQGRDHDGLGLFDTDEPLELTLKADLKPLLKDRGETRSYHSATLTYIAEDSAIVSLDIKARVRGIFRRKFGNCDVPPLMLNFKKKQVEKTIFANQDKVKLVTHCRNKNKTYEQYLLQEYLAYRVYNLLTERSFRVRLARMTYEDSTGKRDPFTEFAFLIEDEEAMTKRNNGSVVDPQGRTVQQRSIDAEHMVLVAVYQYMIGNTDWSLPGLHNIALMQVKGIPDPVAVPYDFDFSGVVNAHYAIPAAQTNITTVRQRAYRGFCRPEADLMSILARFSQQREAIYALYQNNPFLDQKQIKSTLSYFDDFYEVVNNPKKVKREFLDGCRK
jgi:hypothetical protein